MQDIASRREHMAMGPYSQPDSISVGKYSRKYFEVNCRRDLVGMSFKLTFQTTLRQTSLRLAPDRPFHNLRASTSGDRQIV